METTKGRAAWTVIGLGPERQRSAMGSETEQNSHVIRVWCLVMSLVAMVQALSSCPSLPASTHQNSWALYRS